MQSTFSMSQLIEKDTVIPLPPPDGNFINTKCFNESLDENNLLYDSIYESSFGMHQSIEKEKKIPLPSPNKSFINTKQEEDYDVVFTREPIWGNKFSYSKKEPTLNDLRRDIPNSLKLESEKNYIPKSQMLKK